jgi:Flp pilus assembly pilin Flp
MCAQVLRSTTSDEGQDIAEYALIVAVVILVTIGAIRLFWSAINHLGQ